MGKDTDTTKRRETMKGRGYRGKLYLPKCLRAPYQTVGLAQQPAPQNNAIVFTDRGCCGGELKSEGAEKGRLEAG